MLISGVSVVELTRIDRAFERCGLRAQVRFTYENATESLLIKFMPGVAHETTAVEFLDKIRTKILDLPGHSRDSVTGVGTAQFEVGQRSK
jgi:hypothetical protein